MKFLSKMQRWFHRNCTVTIDGNIFIGGEITLNANLTNNGNIYLLTPETEKQFLEILAKRDYDSESVAMMSRVTPVMAQVASRSEADTHD